MLSSASLIAFVATQDPTRARHFYQTTLGLTLISDDEFAIVFEVQGTMLRVQKVPSLTPAAFTALGFQVPDIDAAARALLERGVRCERYPHFEQTELGVWHAPSGGKIAWFKDPDGNTLSLTEL